MSVIAPITKMYLREFFSNYCMAKDIRQQTHAFTVGLEVLEQKLLIFHNRQMEMFEAISKKCGDELPTPSIVAPLPQTYEEEGADTLNLKFECIYNRIKGLMNLDEILFGQALHVVTSKQNPIYGRNNTIREEEFEHSSVNSENQLYDLLAEYRAKNQSLERAISEMKSQLISKDTAIYGLQSRLHQNEAAIQNIRAEQRAKSQQICKLIEQAKETDILISSLHKQIDALNAQLNQGQLRIENLVSQVEEAQEQNKYYVQKLQNQVLRKQDVQQMINSRMSQVKDKLQTQVLQKIKAEDKTIMNKAVVTLVRQALALNDRSKAAQKENCRQATRLQRYPQPKRQNI